MVIDTSALIAILFGEPEFLYSGEPLLFKGNDFSQTDMRAAVTV